MYCLPLRSCPAPIHLRWHICNNHGRPEVQGALLSYTAHQFKEKIKKDNRQKISDYFVADAHRTYQFWQWDSLVKECWSESFLLQKLAYMHNNPCQPHWNLAQLPKEYKWSSAAFYLKEESEFEWLSHYAS